MRAVLESFDDYGLSYDGTADDDTEVDESVRKALHLGDRYTNDQLCVSDALRLGDVLMTSAPEVAFTLTEDPAQDDVGTYISYVPELGVFTAGCDNEGRPLFTRDHILELDNEPDNVRREQLGLPWKARIDALPAQVVHEPEPLTTHWRRRQSEITVVEGGQGREDLVFTATGDEDQVDAALAQQGFQRAGTWAQLDRTGRIWRADVYRISDD